MPGEARRQQLHKAESMGISPKMNQRTMWASDLVVRRALRPSKGWRVDLTLALTIVNDSTYPIKLPILQTI